MMSKKENVPEMGQSKRMVCNGEEYDVLFRPFAKLEVTDEMLQNLTPDMLKSLPADLLSALSPEMMAKLPPAFFENITPEFIESLPMEMLENVSPDFMKQLPPELAKKLSSPAMMIKMAPKLMKKKGKASSTPQMETYEENEIIVEKDVPVTLRDGAVMYTDIYRPKGAERVPCIVAWSPYGKKSLFKVPGVDPDALSDYVKAEGPDPFYWAKMGYALANPDPRGTGQSDGDMLIFGDSESKDGYDFIEWLAVQKWCSGRIGMFGNSYLAMAQWYIAAEQPPHLAAIAPWEGSSDIYRELIFDGGIPSNGFLQDAFGMLRGKNLCEDIITMPEVLPDIDNPYWQSKIAKAEKIIIPTYVTGGYSHFHIMGSYKAYKKVATDKKWFRLHREFEWPDQYHYQQLEDAKRFFDRYLKNIYNGWESTPKVQLDVMDAYDYDYQIRRPETEFPLARTAYQKLYLNVGDSSLQKAPVENAVKISYEAKQGCTTFDYQFTEDTELTGFMKLVCFVEADGNDEMDLFLTVQKLDADKNEIPTLVMGQPHPGAWSKMRVSRRKLSKELSTDDLPVQAFDETQKLSAGEIVSFEAPFFPFSKIWHKGQYLRLVISGHYERDPRWFEPLSWATDNEGAHVIHTGGAYESYLQLPVIPPKYQAGDYVYR